MRGAFFKLNHYYDQLINLNTLMKIKAIITDLDNTIFPVSSIGDKLFYPLFTLLEKSGEYKGDLNEIKKELMRRPFQAIAKEYSFSAALKNDGISILNNLTYEENIQPFEDYSFFKNLRCDKFLVTTGFSRMQQNKIDQLGIRNDFEKVYVIDPETTASVKKDIFWEIISGYGYEPAEVLIIGDDPGSELKAGKELGTQTIYYNHHGELSETDGYETISSFERLQNYLDQ